MPPGAPAAHASSLLAMPAGHPCALMAFWFAGTRESAPDVQIASSCFERASQQWQVAQIVLNRHETGAQLGFGLRRLGNPVAWLDGQGEIHLFVVATGWGGWAASRVLQVREQHAVSRTSSAPVFGEARILPLGWLWNLSHLVRGAPQPLQDGGMVLPAYFELGIKYPVALRFDAAGEFLGMTRMSARKEILQPSLIALNERHWLALMRDNRIDGKIAVAQTGDGGQTWRDLRDLTLINPDASVFALATGPWQFVLAHNSSPKSRQVLDLSESGNGIDWSRIQTLAQGDTVTSGSATLAAEFSYPAMALADGSLWVSYTDNRSRIAWQRFSREPRPKATVSPGK
jgi:predicted neuraminidase